MVPLESLLGAVSRSVDAAGRSLQEASLKSFLSYFEDGAANDEFGASETYEPKLGRFQLNTGNPELMVPLVALTNHSGMALDQVKIVLNVSAKADEQGVRVAVEGGNDDAEPRHQIVLEFKQREPAEGVSRMLDTANQFI